MYTTAFNCHVLQRFAPNSTMYFLKCEQDQYGRSYLCTLLNSYQPAVKLPYKHNPLQRVSTISSDITVLSTVDSPNTLLIKFCHYSKTPN